jgi:hypothetical protein
VSPYVFLPHAAVELEELRRREKEQNVQPDPKIHAFMKVHIAAQLDCCASTPLNKSTLHVPDCTHLTNPQQSALFLDTDGRQGATEAQHCYRLHAAHAGPGAGRCHGGRKSGHQVSRQRMQQLLLLTSHAVPPSLLHGIFA